MREMRPDMKKLPLGMQCFREIIEGGYVYVDKTPYIYGLINNVKYYFLSRPRRFGKSLLLDTIGEVMSGNKELFKKALEGGMRQIESRGYAKKYVGSGKRIYKAAFAFLGRDDIEMAHIVPE